MQHQYVLVSVHEDKKNVISDPVKGRLMAQRHLVQGKKIIVQKVQYLMYSEYEYLINTYYNDCKLYSTHINMMKMCYQLKRYNEKEIEH